MVRLFIKLKRDNLNNLSIWSFVGYMLLGDRTLLAAKEAKQSRRKNWLRRKGGWPGTEGQLDKGCRGQQGKNGWTKKSTVSREKKKTTKLKEFSLKERTLLCS